MRLIDADALIKELKGIKATFGSGNGLVEGGIEIAISTINAQPTVDAVAVVQCKDCKHYVIHVLFGHRQGWCERLCDEFDKSLARGTGDDDFCSRGERRSE